MSMVCVLKRGGGKPVSNCNRERSRKADQFFYRDRQDALSRGRGDDLFGLGTQ